MVFHLYQDVRNEWRWYLSNASGGKLAVSALGYLRRTDCELAIRQMQDAVDAPTLDYDFGTIADVTVAARLAS